MFILYFLLFPMWWLIGLGELGFILLAAILTGHLLKMRTLAVPRGFGLWLLFLGVVLASMATLWSWVPGLAPPGGAERLITFGYWLAWFLTASVFLLYLGNVSESQLSTARVTDLMGWMFLITVAGGYAGQYFADVNFPSLLEALLPRSLSQVGLVQETIHPGLAQVQDILGYEAPRPKAPWAYANSWGANYGLLLPFFIYSFGRRSASLGKKVMLVPILILAVPPVLFSLNRGLWLGLTVVACYVAVRLALQGRLLMVTLLMVLALVGGYVVVQTTLGEILLARLANPHSNVGRSNLAAQAVTTTWANSPVIGLGTPRPMEGNFFSVAAGATDECPQCSPPQIGTQGSVWFVIFTTGFGGALLFLGFLIRRFAAGLRQRSGLSIAMTATGAYLAIVIWVYDVIGSSLVFVMVALALLWRAERGGEELHGP